MKTIEDLKRMRAKIDEQIAELNKSSPPPWARFLMPRLPPCEYDARHDALRLAATDNLVYGDNYFMTATAKADNEGIQVFEALIALIKWYQDGEPDNG